MSMSDWDRYARMREVCEQHMRVTHNTHTHTRLRSPSALRVQLRLRLRSEGSLRGSAVPLNLIVV